MNESRNEGSSSVLLVGTCGRTYWPRLVCSVLVNSDSLTANYDVKQSQFIKPTSEPRASDPKESNEDVDHAIRG